MLPFLSKRIRMEQSKYHQGEKANKYIWGCFPGSYCGSILFLLSLYLLNHSMILVKSRCFYAHVLYNFFLDFCRTKNCLIIFQFISTFSSITIFVNSLVSISNSLRESCGYNLFFRYDWLLHYKWCYAVQKRWGNCCCYCPWAWTLEAQPYCVHLHCYAGLCNSIPELKWIESE